MFRNSYWPLTLHPLPREKPYHEENLIRHIFISKGGADFGISDDKVSLTVWLTGARQIWVLKMYLIYFMVFIMFVVKF